MKQTGTLLILLAWPATLLADRPQSLAKESNKASAHISAMIRAELPGFDPEAASASLRQHRDEPTTAHDSEVLELEKLTVRERAPQKVEPLDILSTSGRDKKLARDFKNSLNGIDGLLNGFSIPILSPSMAERGRVYRQQQQLAELSRLGGAVRGADPKAAAELKKNAADAQRALDEQNRPAGE